MTWHPEEHRHRVIERRYWFLTVLLTSVAAVGAVVSAIYGWRAVIAANRSAEAARVQNETSVRPYVKITFDPKSFAIRPQPLSGQPALSIQFSVDNYGKLPALLRIQSGMNWYDAHHTRQPNLPQATSNVGQRFVFASDEKEPLTAYSEPLGVGDLVDLGEVGRRELEVIVSCLYGPPPDFARYETSTCVAYSIVGNGRDLHLVNGASCPDDRKSYMR